MGGGTGVGGSFAIEPLERLIEKDHGIDAGFMLFPKLKEYLQQKLNDEDLASVIKHYSIEKPTGIKLYGGCVAYYIGPAPEYCGDRRAYYQATIGGLKYTPEECMYEMFCKNNVDIDVQDAIFKRMLKKLSLAEQLADLGEEHIAETIRNKYLRELNL